MHAQTQSSFFSLPAELRRKIYAHLGASAVHVFLRHGKVVISACVEPSGEINLYGYERKPSGKEYMNEDLTGKELAETRWMRRLRSSWGPHWKSLAVCHRMRLDIFSFMTSFAAAKVTDLETLEFLTQGDLKTSPGLFKVKYAADFPLLSELLELDAGFQSLEELETWERGLWESGEDVEQIIFSI
ncbi:hypothetical protein GQ53DRAFT_767186 [Thozetella sp. PMI_491]|nr:hypothetical protein GQ53DRAFT_767186 [Thozetella sp. PMI_491]